MCQDEDLPFATDNRPVYSVYKTFLFEILDFVRIFKQETLLIYFYVGENLDTFHAEKKSEKICREDCARCVELSFNEGNESIKELVMPLRMQTHQVGMDPMP